MFGKISSANFIYGLVDESCLPNYGKITLFGENKITKCNFY